MIVSNSTPLIALSKIKQLQLLKDYFGTITIPMEVFDEIVTRGGALFGAKEVKTKDWIRVSNVKNQLTVDILCRYLDRGEAEAIVLAKENDASLLIIDDSDGRKIAEDIGLKITGTIGILLLAAEDNKLDLNKSLDDLIASGFRLSKKEYKKLIGKDGLHR